MYDACVCVLRTRCELSNRCTSVARVCRTCAHSSHFQMCDVRPRVMGKWLAEHHTQSAIVPTTQFATYTYSNRVGWVVGVCSMLMCKGSFFLFCIVADSAHASPTPDDRLTSGKVQLLGGGALRNVPRICAICGSYSKRFIVSTLSLAVATRY